MLHLIALNSAKTPKFPDQKYPYAISDKKKPHHPDVAKINI